MMADGAQDIEIDAQPVRLALRMRALSGRRIIIIIKRRVKQRDEL
jgi:hypothetical protein